MPREGCRRCEKESKLNLGRQGMWVNRHPQILDHDDTMAISAMGFAAKHVHTSVSAALVYS